MPKKLLMGQYINTLYTQITNKQKCSENVLISLRMWIINNLCVLTFDKNKIKINKKSEQLILQIGIKIA